ncbi:hypothetical protein B0H19DRAFT_1271454 [Mycena capillaripes]|nr:hypothetical protein B0H19DRAFT_1271454 [Mycena capillaripes]
MIRLGVTFVALVARRLLHAVVSKYEYPATIHFASRMRDVESPAIERPAFRTVPQCPLCRQRRRRLCVSSQRSGGARRGKSSVGTAAKHPPPLLLRDIRNHPCIFTTLGRCSPRRVICPPRRSTPPLPSSNTLHIDDPAVFFDVLDAGPMAPLRTAVTCLHAPSIPIVLVPLLNPQDRKRHLRSMYAADGMWNPINTVCSARTPSYADRRDALYTYRDAGLFANDGDGAIYTGDAEVKTGHTGDWAIRRGGYRKCEGGKDMIIWLCTYEADERILAEAAIHNAYIAMGAPRIVRACLGTRCCVKHREFFSLAKIGGLRAMDRTIRAVLGRLGQTRLRRNFLPAPPGFEDLHRELRSALTHR